jgi:uncharacterized integral membrane protein
VSDQVQGPPSRAAGRQNVRKSHTGAYVRLGIIGLIVVLVLVFVFQNTQHIKLSFLWADFSAPAWLTLLIVLVLGVVVGFFLGVRRRKTKRPN